MTTPPANRGTPVGLRLGAYLIRASITKPMDTLSKTANDDGTTDWFVAKGTGVFERASLEAAQDTETALVLRTSISRLPAWQQLLGKLGLPPFQQLDERTSAGAILFVRVNGRLVAWTFGTGSRWLSNRAVDPRFGLLVALNAVASGGQDSGGLLAAHLSPNEGGLLDAELRVGSATRGQMPRFDPMSDRLKGVVAETTHAKLPKVRGSRSVTFEASIASIEDFRTRSAELLVLRDLEAYRDVFAYVENVVEEDDPQVIDAVLAAVWERSDPDNLSLDVDIAWWDDIREDGDDRVVTHFRTPSDPRRQSVPSELRSKNLVLTWQKVRSSLRNKFPEDPPATLMSKELRFYGSDDERLGACEVRDLIVAQPTINGVQYVLSEGEVFRVTTEYLTKLDDFLDGLVVRPRRLPVYLGGDEGRYNRSSGLVLLDGRLILLDENRLELCDLVDPDGRLIFVKRRKRAAAMSHLWAQIVASAIVLRRSDTARVAARNKLEAAGAPARLLDAIAAGAKELTVVLAILGADQIRDMTLLARIPLRVAVQRLQDLGYAVEIELVPGPGPHLPPHGGGG